MSLTSKKKKGGGKRAASKKARGKSADKKARSKSAALKAAHRNRALKGWATRRKNERAILRAAKKETQRRADAATARRLKREQKKRADATAALAREKLNRQRAKITPEQQWKSTNQAIESERETYKEKLLNRFGSLYVSHIMKQTRVFIPWIRHLFLFDPYRKQRQQQKELCSKFDQRFCYRYYDVARHELGQILELLKWFQSNNKIVRFLIALDYEYFAGEDEESEDDQARKIYDAYPASRTPYGYISTPRYDLTGRDTRELIKLVKGWDILSIVVTP